MRNKVVVSALAVLLVMVLQWLDPELLEELSTAYAESETAFGPAEGMSFSQAKRFLQQEVHAPGELDYYCGCEIFAVGKRWQLDLASCGYEVRRNEQRASRIEWEHVIMWCRLLSLASSVPAGVKAGELTAQQMTQSLA